MKLIILVALLLLPTTAFASEMCSEPNAKPKYGQSVLHINNNCFPVNRELLRSYLRSKTGSSAACDAARRNLQPGEVLVVKDRVCVNMPREQAFALYKQSQQ